MADLESRDVVLLRDSIRPSILALAGVVDLLCTAEEDNLHLVRAENIFFLLRMVLVELERATGEEVR